MTVAGTDMHVHLAPELGGHRARGVETSGEALVVDGRPVGPAELYDADALTNYLDSVGLEQAVVSLPPPFHRAHLGPAASAHWVPVANDGLLARIGDRPRLRPLAYLPIHQPAVALDELARIRADTRWAGVSCGVGATAKSLADADLDPLWQALDAESTVLFVHPDGGRDERLHQFYLSNLVGNPTETGLAAAQLIAAGTLERYPRIRVVLAHCGGTLASLVGRMQRGFETRRPGVRVDRQPPSASARRLWVDSVVFDRGLLALAANTFGSDRIVLGSDWPFAMRPPTPDGSLAGLTAPQREAARVTNPAALLMR